jgi:peptidoglycan-N-acetylglucosamine deacetylase
MTRHAEAERLVWIGTTSIIRANFDGAYREGTTFILTLHPYLSRHRAPMEHLDAFVGYMKSKPGVWFATCEQVAEYVKQAVDWKRQP